MTDPSPRITGRTTDTTASAAPCPPPFVLVIFGASGDLAQRKLVPALWQLARSGRLADCFTILGYARTDISDEEFRDRMHEACRRHDGDDFDSEAWSHFAARLFYQVGTYDSATDFERLDARIAQLSGRSAPPTRIYYLATPAGTYESIIEHAGAMPSPGSRRIVVEKPHGRCLAEAQRLNELLARHFAEDEVFRIDHYLGKETVQNILILRFANTIFEPLWNRKYIDYVEITAAETLGVDGRGGFYEQAGALRDMIQGHLLQLLALVAMEQPASFDAADVRDEKAKALRGLRPITPDLVATETVRGQYGPGQVEGSEVLGYRHEDRVADDSNVETYAALTAWIDNWRWKDVPFYLRTGKRLNRRGTEIAIHFQRIPTCLFSKPELCARTEPNVLVLRVQPHEGVHLELSSKVPAEGLSIGSVQMDFSYANLFGRRPPEAYETLLVDVMNGDPALFTRRDQVELAWAYVDPILEAWATTPAKDFPNYAAGTAGPKAADRLAARHGHQWRTPRGR
ncbi:MAG: glucose-6-phosphate dehydrogenase [Planctomycetes bacterium]|nr:glucose-6-phosphate dehydrogenase [Planctomycetota bacterium]